MLNLVLAFLILALVALVAGVVWLNLWVEYFRIGGLYHWRLRGSRGVVFGGSFYRPRRQV